MLCYISNLGMMPALASFVGPLTGELSWPTYDGNIFTHSDFGTLFREYTILGAIPVPPLKMFITSLPMAIVIGHTAGKPLCKELITLMLLLTAPLLVAVLMLE